MKSCVVQNFKRDIEVIALGRLEEPIKAGVKASLTLSPICVIMLEVQHIVISGVRATH